MDDIRYCPMCGDEIQPMYGFENEDRERLYAECPEHGAIEIRVKTTREFHPLEEA